MKKYLIEILSGKKVLILGYGREGRSTLNYLLHNIPGVEITIADRNESAFSGDQSAHSPNIIRLSGAAYPTDLIGYDIIIKSPGISLYKTNATYTPGSITSQTDLFLAVYGKQTIGITGTKGKSTTSSLIYHILQAGPQPVEFGGNIGMPLFELIDRITPETRIVAELSSHQLEHTTHAPHIAILLNLYQEHLDHYKSFLDYQKAKFNIALNQQSGDYFIYSDNDPLIKQLIREYPIKSIHLPSGKEIKSTTGIEISGEEINLKIADQVKQLLPKNFTMQLSGEHNKNNAIIAAAAAALCDIIPTNIEKAIGTFMPLEHRLQYLGTINDKKFYNDSISTIPEAAIAAIESLKPVDTIILGGFDRGIDYTILVDYLRNGNVKNIVTTGTAGFRIYNLLKNNNTKATIFYFDKFEDAVIKAMEATPKSGLCLLSPAASSYNEFKNFEERGRRFKEIILSSITTNQ